MNKQAWILAGVLTVALGVFLGTHLLWAQAPAQPAAQAPSQTRVALVNLAQLIDGYEKTKLFKQSQENTFKPLKADLDKLGNDMKAWAEHMKKPQLTPQEREQGEKAVRDLKHLLDNKEADIRKVMSKMIEEQTVQLFKEVENAVHGFARNNGYTLVLNHGELIKQDEVYSAMNIERKLQGVARTGCCAPLYIAPGTEITQHVLATLNAPYQRAGTPPATPRPGGGQ